MHLMEVVKGALAAASVAAGLSGCVAVWGDSHKITHKDAFSITIESDPGHAGPQQIQSIAEQHCAANRGGRATLHSERRTIAGIDIRRYQCNPILEWRREALSVLRQSLDRFQARDWARAADLASAAINTGSLTDPQKAAAYTIRGFCRLVQRRFDEARADTESAIELQPDFKPALQLRALVQETRSARRSAPRPPRSRGEEELQPPIIQF
jgi:hypothetical protein